MRRNSVLEKLRVKRLAVIHEDMFKCILQVNNGRIVIRGIERVEKLSVISIMVVIQIER